MPETPEHYPTASVTWLKAAYLHCDRVMANRRVDMAFAQRCAVIGEQLKQRGFGGDFAQLIEWWKVERRSDDDTAAMRPATGAERPKTF
jgi:hypothetical protein